MTHNTTTGIEYVTGKDSVVRPYSFAVLLALPKIHSTSNHQQHPVQRKVGSGSFKMSEVDILGHPTIAAEIKISRYLWPMKANPSQMSLPQGAAGAELVGLATLVTLGVCCALCGIFTSVGNTAGRETELHFQGARHVSQCVRKGAGHSWPLK